MIKTTQKHSKPKQPTLPYRHTTPNFCLVSFIEGACLEIVGDSSEKYLVQFIDPLSKQTIHQGIISTNQWIKTSRQYFTPWHVTVTRIKDNAVVFSHNYDCNRKRVYIALESSSLGDTLAWLPAIETFGNKHGCKMICSTFLNDLFASEYPEIDFIEPGTIAENLYAMYRIGWFYDDHGEVDYNKNVHSFRQHPLGKTAYDILGLAFNEKKPRLKTKHLIKPPIKSKYVCIAVHATAQAKYWNNSTGWQNVVDFIRTKGYEVILLSKEGKQYMGNKAPDNVTILPEGPIKQIIDYLKHAHLFIGIGSGLSWLSWAVGCRTCLISGFSYPFTEMQDCIRITPKAGVCSGCFNRSKLDPDNWLWCPDHQNTSQMFTCTRSIKASDVIGRIKDFI